MHVYAMHVYAMHVYAMHVYAMHVYAMHMYAMHVYAMHVCICVHAEICNNVLCIFACTLALPEQVPHVSPTRPPGRGVGARVEPRSRAVQQKSRAGQQENRAVQQEGRTAGEQESRTAESILWLLLTSFIQSLTKCFCSYRLLKILYICCYTYNAHNELPP
jgi:hypothetical protein